MVDAALSRAGATDAPARTPLMQSKLFLGLLFMLPAAIFLVVFLSYPLGLGVWLGFTDTRIGRSGVFVGLENYQLLWDDSIFWLSVFNTILYTVVASILKFMLGAPALGGADGAVGHRLLVDLRHPILDHLLGVHVPRMDRFSHQLPGRSQQRPRHGDPHQCVARHSLRGDHAARRPSDDLALAP
jgi:hypothetical protein